MAEGLCGEVLDAVASFCIVGNCADPGNPPHAYLSTKTSTLNDAPQRHL